MRSFANSDLIDGRPGYMIGPPLSTILGRGPDELLRNFLEPPLDDLIVKSLGFKVSPGDLVILVTKDGVTEEEMCNTIDPEMQILSDDLSCSIIAVPESVFSDLKILDIQDLLNLKELVDEVVAFKLSDDKIATS